MILVTFRMKDEGIPLADWVGKPVTGSLKEAFTGEKNILGYVSSARKDPDYPGYIFVEIGLP